MIMSMIMITKNINRKKWNYYYNIDKKKSSNLTITIMLPPQINNNNIIHMYKDLTNPWDSLHLT